jgi:beta-glucanase (GH16 family)
MVRQRSRILPAPGPRTLMALAAAALALALPLAAIKAFAAIPPPPAGWTQVFADDFTGAAGTGVNTGNWLYDLGHGYPGGAGNWGTGEVESMTNSTTNVRQDGAGHLAITPVRDSAGNWTSGRIETQRTDFAAPAGGKLRVQAAIQQPNVSGAAAAGYWPAFWMMGAAARPVGATNWPSIGEIDILEDINGRSSEFGTLHCGNTASGGPCNETTGIGSGERACAGCQTGFHTYAMELDRSVSPEQIRWYLDGTNFFTVNANQVDATTWNNATHHGFFIILDLAMGGGFPAAFGGGPTASTASGVPMLVDYVAVYTSGGGGTTTPPTTTPPTTTPPGGGVSATSTIQAESFNAQSGVQTEATTDTGGGQDIGFIANGDWARYDNVNFGTSPLTQFRARVASGAAGGVSGLVEVRLDNVNNPPLGSFAIANTGGWQSWVTVPANISGVTGTHTVFLRFSSGQPADFVNVNWFTFGT